MYTMAMKELLDRIAAEARTGGMNIDVETYTSAGRDPDLPVLLGSGSLTSRIGFFGRDPGRREVELGEPFIGKGGQLVRSALYRAAGGSGPLTEEEAITIGQKVFWGNTVPYKPVGNKAWSTSVKRRFLPYIRELLVVHWRGSELITLGNQAFEWFGLADGTLRPRLREYWKRDDRYESSLEITLDGKTIRLFPLPHPSPLNATWHALFPSLLDARLRELDWPS